MIEENSILILTVNFIDKVNPSMIDCRTPDKVSYQTSTPTYLSIDLYIFFGWDFPIVYFSSYDDDNGDVSLLRWDANIKACINYALCHGVRRLRDFFFVR